MARDQRSVMQVTCTLLYCLAIRHDAYVVAKVTRQLLFVLTRLISRLTAVAEKEQRHRGT